MTTPRKQKALTVVAREPGLLPFGKAEGRPTKRWDKVLLSDETVAFECNDEGCGRRYEDPRSMFAHLSHHSDRSASPTRATRTTAKKLQAAITLIQESMVVPEPVKATEDKWRTRALTAERKLTQLRKALSLDE